MRGWLTFDNPGFSPRLVPGALAADLSGHALEELPSAEESGTDWLAVLRQWLARHDCGLVSIADPQRFSRGIDLNDLVGREFTIGSMRAFGQRLCEPCIHLQRLTPPGVVAGLVHRGGLRADILTDGEIHLGDEIKTA